MTPGPRGRTLVNGKPAQGPGPSVDSSRMLACPSYHMPPSYVHTLLPSWQPAGLAPLGIFWIPVPWNSSFLLQVPAPASTPTLFSFELLNDPPPQPPGFSVVLRGGNAFAAWPAPPPFGADEHRAPAPSPPPRSCGTTTACGSATTTPSASCSLVLAPLPQPKRPKASRPRPPPPPLSTERVQLSGHPWASSYLFAQSRKGGEVPADAVSLGWEVWQSRVTKAPQINSTRKKSVMT